MFNRKSTVPVICPGAAYRLGIERRRIDIHAGTRLPYVDDDQTNDQGDGADDLEIENRQSAGLSDLLHVLHAGDADDDGAEDDGRDDHLDQLDETVAERLHRRPGFRVEMAKQHADDDGDDDLEVKTLEYRSLGHGFELL
jgi:hypothetical protein